MPISKRDLNIHWMAAAQEISEKFTDEIWRVSRNGFTKTYTSTPINVIEKVANRVFDLLRETYNSDILVTMEEVNEGGIQAQIAPLKRYRFKVDWS